MYTTENNENNITMPPPSVDDDINVNRNNNSIIAIDDPYYDNIIPGTELSEADAYVDSYTFLKQLVAEGLMTEAEIPPALIIDQQINNNKADDDDHDDDHFYYYCPPPTHTHTSRRSSSSSINKNNKLVDIIDAVYDAIMQFIKFVLKIICYIVLGIVSGRYYLLAQQRRALADYNDRNCCHGHNNTTMPSSLIPIESAQVAAISAEAARKEYEKFIGPFGVLDEDAARKAAASAAAEAVRKQYNENCVVGPFGTVSYGCYGQQKQQQKPHYNNDDWTMPSTLRISPSRTGTGVTMAYYSQNQQQRGYTYCY